MPTTVQPSVTLAVVDFFRTHPALVALGATVGSKLPKSPTWPFVVVSRLGGPVRYPGWVANPRLQVASWSTDDKQAEDTADAAVAATFDLPGIHDRLVITNAGVDAGPQQLWDATPATARTYYVFSALLTAHPVP